MRQASRYSPPPTDERGALLCAYRESERFVKENERERITSISRTTWWRLEKADKCRKEEELAVVPYGSYPIFLLGCKSNGIKVNLAVCLLLNDALS